MSVFRCQWVLSFQLLICIGLSFLFLHCSPSSKNTQARASSLEAASLSAAIASSSHISTATDTNTASDSVNNESAKVRDSNTIITNTSTQTSLQGGYGINGVFAMCLPSVIPVVCTADTANDNYATQCQNAQGTVVSCQCNNLCSVQITTLTLTSTSTATGTGITPR